MAPFSCLKSWQSGDPASQHPQPWPRPRTEDRFPAPAQARAQELRAHMIPQPEGSGLLRRRRQALAFIATHPRSPRGALRGDPGVDVLAGGGAPPPSTPMTPTPIPGPLGAKGHCSSYALCRFTGRSPGRRSSCRPARSPPGRQPCAGRGARAPSRPPESARMRPRPFPPARCERSRSRSPPG
jgi:hypothetical protein